MQKQRQRNTFQINNNKITSRTKSDGKTSQLETDSKNMKQNRLTPYRNDIDIFGARKNRALNVSCFSLSLSLSLVFCLSYPTTANIFRLILQKSIVPVV